MSVCGACTRAPDVCNIYILAECVALWGEPEQAVHGMKSSSKQLHEGEKRNNFRPVARFFGGGFVCTHATI